MVKNVTFEGKPLTSPIDSKESHDEIQSVHQETIQESKRALLKIRPPRNFIQHNREPGPVLTLTEREVQMSDLLTEIHTEAESKSPNKSKIIAATLMMGEFLTPLQVSKKILDLTDKKVVVSDGLVSNVLYRWLKPEDKRPITKLFEKQKVGKGYAYRLHPALSKLTVWDIMELTQKNGKGEFATYDLFQRVPEVVGCFKETPVAVKEVVVTTKETPDSSVNEVPPTQETPVKGVVTAQPEAPIKEATFQPQINIPQTINVKVEVKILFGVI